MKPPLASRARAFTLIEVMIASVIMAITIAAVALVLRTGVRAWSIGHNSGEIFQTARITEDTVVRDLDNMVFMDDLDYNRNFRMQLQQLAQQYAANPDLMDKINRPKHHSSEMRGKDDKENPLNLENISPPIDLSFRGTNGDKLDRLSFTRSQVPRFSGDPTTWGLRRVSYYVRDGVLYRREEDPFGLSPGAVNVGAPMSFPGMGNGGGGGMRGAFQNDPMANQQMIRQDLARLFMLPDESGMNATDLTQSAGEGTDADAMKPTTVRVEEPLCEGVEIFDITYGYFKDGEWQEAKDWYSNVRHYRNPPEDEATATNGMGMPQNSVSSGGSVSTGGNSKYGPAQQIGGMAAQDQRPDKLPGYIAIQLGIRIPGEEIKKTEDGQPKEKPKGRVYSFTFYHSLPEGEETDVDQTSMNPPR